MRFLGIEFGSRPKPSEKPRGDGSVSDNYELSGQEAEGIDLNRQLAALDANIKAAENDPNHPHAGDLTDMRTLRDNLAETKKRLGV